MAFGDDDEVVQDDDGTFGAAPAPMTPAPRRLTLQEIAALPHPQDRAHARLALARELGDPEKEQDALAALRQATDDAHRNAQIDAVNSMGWGGQVGAALGAGALHGARQALNFSFSSPAGSPAISDEAVKQESKEFAPLQRNSPWAYAAGTAAPAAVATLAAPQSAPLRARILINALLGGLQGGAFADPGERRGGAIVGAGVNALLPAVGAVAKGAVKGYAQPRGGGAFLNAASSEYGDRLTTGQLAGGAFRDLEEGATHLPFFGNKVQAAQNEGKTVLMDELEMFTNPKPVPGVTPAPLPRGSLKEWWHGMMGRVNSAYDDLKTTTKQLPAVWNAQLRQAVPWAGPLKDLPVQYSPADLQTHIAAAVQASGVAPGTDAFKQMVHVLKNEANKVLNGSGPTWGSLHDLRIDLRALAAKQKDDGVKAALKSWERNITQELHKPLSQVEQQALADADRAYANVLLVREAAIEQAGMQGGYATVLEARPLRHALESRLGDTKKAGGGGGWLRDFVEAADDALGPKAINAANAPGHLTSSSAGRSIGSYLYEAAAALPAALGFYSKPGQRALKGTTGTQRALTRALATPAGQTIDNVGAAVVQPVVTERATQTPASRFADTPVKAALRYFGLE